MEIKQRSFNPTSNCRTYTGRDRLFFQLNMNNEVQTQMVWDTYQAIMRGNMMALNGKDKKKKQEKYKEIQESIKQK